jgi:tRNA-2-methylthio-N6-dimethylallyladenosine synthase
MDEVKFEFSYMYFYSERPGTLAAKKLEDDVPVEIKKRRLQEVIDKQHELSYESNKKDLGKIFKVLIEGESKKSKNDLYGRSSAYKVVVFPREEFKKGQYVNVLIESCSSATLVGKAVGLA